MSSITNGESNKSATQHQTNDIVDIKDVELTLLPSYLQDGFSGLMTEVENQRTCAPNELVELLNPSKSSQQASISNQKNAQPPQRPPRNHGQHGKIAADQISQLLVE